MKAKLFAAAGLSLMAAASLPSGSLAADAVMAIDPEPAEYVKECAAYGTGYFYIPGEATCLRIRGQVRYQQKYTWYSPNSKGVDRRAETLTEAQIDLFAKNDSEFGMIYSWIRFEGSYLTLERHFDPETDPVNRRIASGTDTMLLRALFGIGGAEFGYYNSQFSTFFGDGGVTDLAGVYINNEFKLRHQASYTFYQDYFSAIVSLESNEEPKTYMPDVVAGARYDFGGVRLSAGGGYDKSDESIAYVARLDGTLGQFGFVLEALGANSKHNSYFDYNGISVIGGISYNATEKLKLAADLQGWDNGDWLAIADVAYVVTPGFRVLGELASGDIEDVKLTSGMLRFERFF
jgi:hypothetical protein